MDDPVVRRGAELFGGPVEPVEEGGEMVYAAMPAGWPRVGVAREPQETLAARLNEAVLAAAVNGRAAVIVGTVAPVEEEEHPSRYIARDWPEGINTYRYEQGEEYPIPADPGTATCDVGVVAFKIQCIDCRQQFGRWWKLKKDAPMPSAEEVRARGRAFLEAADFSYDDDGWHCPTVTGLGSYRDMMISEGGAMDGYPWEES